ncbi:unnamed protein product [Cladocopium goreaui]|uniref:Uncharacterized protein n=1 Tax=Cladocopium goreaui TaxID=2562237 RepID=A0A9P1DLS1_9DINO|nr:unnamed protein product [Cladocopium goreaui]
MQIQQKLQENGLMYQQTLKPTQPLVHPLNRGGAMLSHYDCHHKGANILAIGPDLNKIQASVAIEVPNQMAKKKSQIAANDQRALCAHQAVLHGCTTLNEELAAIAHNGNLNLQFCCGSQGNQNPFYTMCTEGWE